MKKLNFTFSDGLIERHINEWEHMYSYVGEWIWLDGHTFINWEIDLIESLKALAFTKWEKRIFHSFAFPPPPYQESNDIQRKIGWCIQKRTWMDNVCYFFLFPKIFILPVNQACPLPSPIPSLVQFFRKRERI